MGSVGSAPYLIGALLLGVAAGLTFGLAWRYFFPPKTQKRFWMSLTVLSQQAVTVDTTSEFLALYRNLGTTLGGFLGRNFGTLGVGGLGIVVAMVFGLQPLGASFDTRSGTLVASDPALERLAQRHDGRLTYKIGTVPVAVIDTPVTRTAICSGTWWSCAGLSLLDFDIVDLPDAPRSFASPMIIRAAHGDVTPLWPYLNDLETLFFAALMIAMTVSILWRPKSGREAEAAPILRQSDFALVQLNTQLRPLVQALGNLETRLARGRLATGEIRAPIFITGMARSGTTTLLNALTRTRELGAHQYRDFPFLMAPLLWHRVQGAIATEGEAVERPHKDRILITKSSHDAFEEPLWQGFFPDIHDDRRDQRLGANTSNPRFEKFFHEHIRKILHLRGAGRYVSKGNYNIGRIEYLGRLFPDARFIVPVRAPLDHVGSLVRQHELFCSYAADDPRIPLYLAATGHFEFGPQRRGINLSGPKLARLPDREDDALCYARQWAEVYGHVVRIRARDSQLGARIDVVRYEDLCADPAAGLAAIVDACRLVDPDGAIRAFAATISESRAVLPSSVERLREEIEAIVRPVAAALGYAIADGDAPRATSTRAQAFRPAASTAPRFSMP